jgi:hypothetical protein
MQLSLVRDPLPDVGRCEGVEIELPEVRHDMEVKN